MMWPFSPIHPHAHLPLMFSSLCGAAANNLSQLCTVSSPAADPSKLLILQRTHTCPQKDINTHSNTHTLFHIHTHSCRGKPVHSKIHKIFVFLFPISATPSRKHVTPASKCHENLKNTIYFCSFHWMTLDSVMEMKGKRERERCMSSKWLKPPECGGGACVRVCCRHSRGRGGLKKQRIRLHHSCQRYGGEKQGEWGPRQGCREKRAGREKRELGGGDTVHVILKGSGGNKAIKLRLIGKEKESTESIGNWEKEMEWKRDVGNRIQSSAEEKRGSDKEPMWSENVKKNRERMWVSQYNHTYSNNLIITRVKQLL